MKWMDTASVTEMDRGGVYEMDRRKKCRKNGNATERENFYKIVWTGSNMCYFIQFI